MSKKNSKPIRTDPLFEEWTKEIAIERIKNNLEREMISPREVTRMFLNTESRSKIEEELTTRPRRKQ